MSAEVALADDALTVEFDGTEECPDLTADEAAAVTGRIRRWVNDFPVTDVVLAFRGRVWVALAYDSWAEWCECELGGLKLPAPKRREVVKELASVGMSNRAIAAAVGSSEPTVRRDVDAGASNDAPDRTRIGQDGKAYSPPHPKPVASQPEPQIVDAEIVCRDCDGHGCETCYSADEMGAPGRVESASRNTVTFQHGAGFVAPGEEIPIDTETTVDIDTGEVIEEKPIPEPEPERKRRQHPLPDSFWRATFDLKKRAESVVRLAADNRFKKNKDQIADVNLSDLIRVRDALTGVIQQLEG